MGSDDTPRLMDVSESGFGTPASSLRRLKKPLPGAAVTVIHARRQRVVGVGRVVSRWLDVVLSRARQHLSEHIGSCLAGSRKISNDRTTDPYRRTVRMSPTPKRFPEQTMMRGIAVLCLVLSANAMPTAQSNMNGEYKLSETKASNTSLFPTNYKVLYLFLR